MLLYVTIILVNLAGVIWLQLNAALTALLLERLPTVSAMRLGAGPGGSALPPLGILYILVQFVYLGDIWTYLGYIVDVHLVDS